MCYNLFILDNNCIVGIQIKIEMKLTLSYNEKNYLHLFIFCSMDNNNKNVKWQWMMWMFQNVSFIHLTGEMIMIWTNFSLSLSLILFHCFCVHSRCSFPYILSMLFDNGYCYYYDDDDDICLQVCVMCECVNDAWVSQAFWWWW